jgi:hypothetical protein
MSNSTPDTGSRPNQLVIGYWRPDLQYDDHVETQQSAEELLVIQNTVNKLPADVLILSTLHDQERAGATGEVMRELGYAALRTTVEEEAEAPAPAAQPVYRQSVWIAPHASAAFHADSGIRQKTKIAFSADTFHTYDEAIFPQVGPNGLAIQVVPPEASANALKLLGTLEAMLQYNTSANRYTALAFRRVLPRTAPMHQETVIVGEFGDRYRFIGGIAFARRRWPDAIDQLMNKYSFQRANTYNMHTGWDISNVLNRTVDLYSFSHPEHPAGVEVHDFTAHTVATDAMPRGVTAPVTVTVSLKGQKWVPPAPL